MEFIATFFTHSGAVKYKRYLKKIGIEVELLPVPRRLSSDCGIGARFTTSADIKTLISDDIDKLFLAEEGGEKLIYSSEAK
ncbi:MAG: DUF3343 domain-containing protein [Bacillota bacterium]|jgi:hypothetical protein|nr:DUF3343 domain-containing protein [Bacillota bacterium]NLJ01958.1 DUF3343 domain-containing protein [Bacillota bacterium]